MPIDLTENQGSLEKRTAHLTPIIQEPPIMSPFLRTARIASAGFMYPTRKQFEISGFCSGSVVSPMEQKYSAVTLYLSGGYPKTTTYRGCAVD